MYHFFVLEFLLLELFVLISKSLLSFENDVRQNNQIKGNRYFEKIESGGDTVSCGHLYFSERSM